MNILRYTGFFMLAVATTYGHAQETEVYSVMSRVTECDIFAAHPDDPMRYADGVYDDEVIPQLTLDACGAALDGAETEADWARLAFQYGRGLSAAGDAEEAVKQFQEAAQAGSAAANGYLGDAYNYGIGVSSDTATAKKYYEAAAKGGFDVAEQQITTLTFDKNKFVAADLLGSVYSGVSLDSSAKDDVDRNHLFTFIETLLRECGLFIPANGLTALLDFRYQKGWSAEIEATNLNLLKSTTLAEYDADRFLQDYGCDGVVAIQMKRSISRVLGSGGKLQPVKKTEAGEKKPEKSGLGGLSIFRRPEN